MTRTLLTLVILSASSAALYAIWKPPKVQAQPKVIILDPQPDEPPTLGRLPINPPRRDSESTHSIPKGRVALLECIAKGESNNNPRAVSRTGKFRGLLQFSRTTWDYAARRYGRPDLIGVDPIDASAEDQWDLGLRLLTAEGAGHWPIVSRGCL